MKFCKNIMKFLKNYNFLILLVILFNFDVIVCQEDSITNSFLSGLLDTLTRTDETKDCPGMCIHTLATFICADTLDNVACPSTSMKCCIDSSITTTTTTTSSKITSSYHLPIKNTKNKNNFTQIIQNTTSVNEISNESNQIENKKDENKCLGVCVREKISNYCEAILDGKHFCDKGLKCCVSKDIYGDEIPPNLIIPKKNITITTSSSITTKSTTATTKKKATIGAPTTTTTTTGSIESMGTTNRYYIENKLPKIRKPCSGECVGSLMAFFCDTDPDGSCPESESCCIFNTETKDQTLTSTTISTSTLRTELAATTKMEIATKKPFINPPSVFGQNGPCLGYCLLNIMAAFCTKPSILKLNTYNCTKGFVCCDHSEKVTMTIIPTTEKIKLKPMITKTTTKPTIKPTMIDNRIECPGTCILSYLSFTCFRNAEMTDLFQCKKSGTECCAPKSVIHEAFFKYNFTTHTTIEKMDELLYANQNTSNIIKKITQIVPVTHSQPLTSTSTSASSSSASASASTLASASASLTTTSTKIPQASISPVYNENYLTPFLNSTTGKSQNVYNKYVCGVKGTSRTAKVVGGEDGQASEWCWHTALINSLNQYLCGAALIGTQWVLTAAHCVTNIVRSGDTIYVRIGDHDLTKKHPSVGAQTLKVSTTYVHHNHNSQTLDNDIALLKLQGQAELSDGVCLVCLPARGVNHAAGKRCIVTGYGYMSEAGPIPLRIREAEIPIVSDSECIRKVNAVTEKIFILPASSFCAGGEEGNDACQGDGGGPLVCQDDGFYELVGLVSWGFGCGRKDVPGVYVKVSSFIGWINQIISVNNL